METLRPSRPAATPGRAPLLLRAVVLAWAVLLLATSTSALAGAAAQEEADEPAAAEPVLEYYGTDACPFCREMQPFLDELEERHPGLEVVRYDVEDSANAARWEEQMAARGERAQGVPTAILDDEVWIGFNDQIADEIAATVADTPGVDEPREDVDDGVAAPEDSGPGGGPSPLAIAIGAVVVLAIAVALFAPRRAKGGQA